MNIQSCSLAIYPPSNNAPKATINPAAPTSIALIKSIPNPDRALAMRLATVRALTATVAIAATVMAVPNPMISVAAVPVQNRSWASAKMRTMIAPEQGRSPTAMTADRPRRQPPAPASSAGSGPCAWPQAEA